MQSIKNTYQNVIDFFTPINSDHSNNYVSIPEHLQGIWSLENVKNMSMFMSFNNAEHNEKKRRMIVRLYEKGNWLFNEKNVANTYFNKWFKYSYQFDFNEDYTYADIHVRLGSLPLYFPKSVFDWSVKMEGDKMVRKTKMFGSTHNYEAFKLEGEEYIDELNEKGIHDLYYI